MCERPHGSGSTLVPGRNRENAGRRAVGRIQAEVRLGAHLSERNWRQSSRVLADALQVQLGGHLSGRNWEKQ